MRHLFFILFSLFLVLSCKTTEPERLSTPFSTPAVHPDTFADTMSADVSAKQNLAQRIFGQKAAYSKQVPALPKKCKNCYIVNVQADNGATVTAPVSQGDTDTKNKNGSLVAPQTQNTAPSGTIQADQKNEATAPPAKSKAPFLLFAIGLLVGAAFLGRFLLKRIYG